MSSHTVKQLWVKQLCGIASSVLFFIVAFMVCFSSGCDRTYCLTGESRCTEDLSAIEVCDRGEWAIEQLCEEGTMCMRDASSGDGHAHGHRGSSSLSCVDHQNDEGDEHSMDEDAHHTGEHSHALNSWESYTREHDSEHDRAMSRADEE